MNDDGTTGDLLSLPQLNNATSSLTSTHMTLGGDEEDEDEEEETAMVTLEESQGESLIMCHMDSNQSRREHSTHTTFSPDTSLSYAALDAGGNIVLKPIKQNAQDHSADNSFVREDYQTISVRGKKGHVRRSIVGPQLMVVGDAQGGDAMTYIYIQGEDEGPENCQKEEGTDSHTITLNSADGSTLHTLHAAYSQHLEHTYGDLVLVGEDTERDSTVRDERETDKNSTISIADSSNANAQQDKQVLLLSVGPLKLDQDSGSELHLPTSTQESKKQEPLSPPSVGVEGAGVSRGRREVICSGNLHLEDEASTIEARLATRDSMLPPRRTRRSNAPWFLNCAICKAQFKSRRQYRSHLQLHQDDGMWPCDMCDHSSESLTKLNLHKSEMHEAARPYKCIHCDLRFSKCLMLEDHVRSVHNKERPYSCSFCAKGFYRPHDLKMHLNLHLGIKSNVCHICGRQFSHPSNLIRHHRVHTGIKPYVCTRCGKRFTQITLLQKHYLIHHSVAGVCPHCPATFNSANGLRRHSKAEHKKTMTLQEAARIIHGDHGTNKKRSYYCRVCGNQFNTKFRLEQHERQQHADGMEHHCASCNKVFSSAEDVKIHTCLTVEEVERRNRSSISTTVLGHPAATVQSDQNLDGAKKAQESNIEPEEEEEEEEDEEEEYLVMYITPEGESVSYVMKRGKTVTRDKVLQIDAPQGDQVNEQILSRPALPEETILINVQDRSNQVMQPKTCNQIELLPEVNTITASDKEDESIATTVALNQSCHESSLGLQNVKVEPKSYENILPDEGKSIQVVELEQKSRVRPIYTILSSKQLEEKGYSSVSEDNAKPVLRKGGVTPEIKWEVMEGDTEESNDVKLEPKETPPPLTCKDCGKSFQRRWNFQQHIATHDASLHKYVCTVCNCTFAYRSTLKKHMEKHKTTQEVYKCPDCDKTYRYHASLYQHIKRDHWLRRPYVCDLCQKSFYNKCDFKYHMRVHTKEKPYMCFSCGRHFNHISHLHRHEKTHTGEKPHKCPFCPKRFIQLVTLKVHLKKHEKKLSSALQTPEDAPGCTDANVSISLDLGTDMIPSRATTTVANIENAICDRESVMLNVADCKSGSTNESLSVQSAEMRLETTMTESAGVIGNSGSESEALQMEGLPPGTVIFTQGGLDGTSTTGDCIAIFVQDGIR